MINRHFDNRKSTITDHGGEETMHPVKGDYVFQAVSSKCFDAAPRIAYTVIHNPAAHPVSQKTRKTSYKGIMASLSIAAYTVRMPERFQQGGNVSGIIL